MPDLPALRTARKVALAYARRAVHESLVGLPAWGADEARANIALLESEVRAAAFAEAEQAIRAACFTHNPGAEHGWITCHCDVADEIGRPTAPRLRDLPPGEFGDLVRKITPSSREQRHA